MSNSESIRAFIFLLNWGIIWNLERQQITCNEDWHLLFLPISATHRSLLMVLLSCNRTYAPFFWARCAVARLTSQWTATIGGLLDATLRGKPRLHGTAASSRVMTSFWLQTSPAARILNAIVPPKWIPMLTCVKRSNTCVFTFHTAHCGYDQPMAKLKLLPGCGMEINCPLQSGYT